MYYDTLFKVNKLVKSSSDEMEIVPKSYNVNVSL